MIRVVADTNIYLSALMFGGLPGIFLDLALARVFDLVVSGALLDELDEKLLMKFGMAPEEAAAIGVRLEWRRDGCLSADVRILQELDSIAVTEGRLAVPSLGQMAFTTLAAVVGAGGSRRS